ncbi:MULTISPECIES: restriction endonuclease [Dysgonomonas]|uniref:Restriction endonuclease type IV Mrr domain-containing protein n=1 Tax=Dysgonomonas gadei ATCC BAA-286 TaxID=742766 RepID=F5J3Y2_9BACT|nr:MULTISPECIES: restriction endonuclease [Dysgonomonas]EGJ99553.1 hypothetical protein HMPREF9455_04049 [Dysgonomonas gadei ATCC BAA-286]MBF0650902.1 restriction endonuclease [Dysgonomonas sp. GY75]
MSYNIVSGITQHFYHTVPSELDLITTTPTREGIFKYLSQIGYDKFPEFIFDILIKVEGHTPVDVTDGQGDEKQDILTINPKGERCLTQCKHTVDYKSHYNGDDLDLLVVACMRKACKQAIFVTNADLTPQGKKYVNDREYNRGYDNPADCPTIDYWNGFKIWDKIKNNKDIINKWFSGLGQVHGLRSFKFDLTIQELPFKKDSNHENNSFDAILKLLSGKSWMTETVPGFEYKADISKDYEVNIKKWFQFTGELDINYLLPNQDVSFLNQPAYALTIEVHINSSIEKYSPSEIRGEIVNKIANEILTNNTTEKWWHITSSQIRSIIYLHDISEPREIQLTQATTFVKTHYKATSNELSYCSLLETQFDLSENDEDSIWRHKMSGIQVVQMFEQPINPVEQYNYQLIQYRQLENIKSHNFYAVENIDSSLLMRIRRILDHEWIAFQHNENNLIWGVPPEYNLKKVELINKKLELLNLKVLKVRQEDVTFILENVQKDIMPSSWMFTSDMKSISFPILLNQRIFWLSKELPLKSKIGIDNAMKLLEYKYSLEDEYGFNHLQGKNEMKLNSSELRELLFDFFTFRGKRMLDISIYDEPISINVRFSEKSTESSQNLATKYIDDFLKIYDYINNLIN